MSSVGTKRKRPGKQTGKVNVTNVPDDEELSYLEKIVLKGGSEVFDDISLESDSDDESPSKEEKTANQKKPAWVDEDDDVTCEEIVKQEGRKFKVDVNMNKKYKEVIEQKYHQVMGVPKWAKKSKKTETLGGLLNTCGKLIKKPKFLDKDVLEYRIMSHLNLETRTEGSLINVVKFHPKSTIAMVAGNSGVVSLFQVKGKENPKLHSIKFQKYPINCGAFLKNGEELLVGSQQCKYFNSYNLMTGKLMTINHSELINIKNMKSFCVSPNDDFIAVRGIAGTIFLFTASTKEYVRSFQMNSEVTALAFNHDGSFLYSHSEDGEVYIWDMKSMTCIQKFLDDGCLTGTSICISKMDQFIACGSSSGVVNIYDSRTVHSGKDYFPMKTVFNLVTPVTSLLFNSTNEILVMASKEKDNAVKLLHCPSMTVFSNFLNFSRKFKKPLCVDFSPNSGFLAIGDDRGAAQLIRLPYYGNY